MNKTTTISIGIALVVISAGLVLWQKGPATTPAQSETTPVQPSAAVESTSPAAPSAAASGITSTEVATHNSRTSCWSTINGAVYDLTSWIPEHPGGEEGILKLCGKDGSARYNGQHGGAQKQAAILFGFKVGVAAN